MFSARWSDSWTLQDPQNLHMFPVWSVSCWCRCSCCGTLSAPHTRLLFMFLSSFRHSLITQSFHHRWVKIQTVLFRLFLSVQSCKYLQAVYLFSPPHPITCTEWALCVCVIMLFVMLCDTCLKWPGRLPYLHRMHQCCNDCDLHLIQSTTTITSADLSSITHHQRWCQQRAGLIL